MWANSHNCSDTSYFILSGIPSLEDFNFWMGFPLILMYVIAVIGNTSILYIIKVDQELHEPMYIFLFMLSMIDLLLATTTMPKMLEIFLMDDKEISFDLCLTQMFFIHFLSALESGILVAMAVDRYVAICHPLRYSSILTSEKICTMFAIILVRGALVIIPIPLIIKRLPLWKNNHLTHSYCLHQEVMNLACGDIKVNIIYGLFVILSVMGIDSLFIFFSYMLIIKTVLGLVEEASMKAFSTCASHICAVLVYYIPLIGLSVVHRFKSNTMPNLHILFGNVYLLLPPVINPLIYGIKTKQIRHRLKKLYGKIFHRRKNSRNI
ncbi:olfactory receptor 51E1-like [Bufo gargarizans]|uniref:olfactory receptor 51E1-like n=1 Tax=Bufo gargarizans TaxID=30331 RepID=UPI001CF101C0|nr:olfactory receptor 51E1-like [Bufo gargarizans]